MAREMVAQLGHHACIIGWIVQNESKTFEPGAAEFFRAIHDAFKEADPSRFTLAAESPEPPEHLTVVKKVQHEPEGALPPTAAFLDVLGVNCYAGWYANKSDYLPKLLDHVHAQLASGGGERPMLVTEFGAEGILGQRSLEMHPWTEDYQSELICRHIREILKRDWVAGFFLWLFIDYEAASITIRGINAKGLVDEYRRPKLAFNEVRALLQPLSQLVFERPGEGG
jgi:beta-glucuronidase